MDLSIRLRNKECQKDQEKQECICLNTNQPPAYTFLKHHENLNYTYLTLGVTFAQILILLTLINID